MFRDWLLVFVSLNDCKCTQDTGVIPSVRQSFTKKKTLGSMVIIYIHTIYTPYVRYVKCQRRILSDLQKSSQNVKFANCQKLIMTNTLNAINAEWQIRVDIRNNFMGAYRQTKKNIQFPPVVKARKVIDK